jgi:hypothetical protein
MNAVTGYHFAVANIPEWLEKRLDNVAARLFAEYRDHTEVPESRLRSVIEEARLSYGGGCVHEFAPLVIERAIRDQLRSVGAGMRPEDVAACRGRRDRGGSSS